MTDDLPIAKKTCTVCGRTLSLIHFPGHHGEHASKDGLYPHCRECHRDDGAEKRDLERDERLRDRSKRLVRGRAGRESFRFNEPGMDAVD